MTCVVAANDNARPEELEEVRRYDMRIVWSPEDEVFVVSFPDAPGVMTHGVTREEAAAQGEDAIISWLTAHHDAGLPVPPPTVTARNTPAPRSVPHHGPEEIRRIRRRLDVSQQVLADALNVSLGTVRSWEQGLRQPDGAAMRLISIADDLPEILLDWSHTKPASPQQDLASHSLFACRGERRTASR